MSAGTPPKSKKCPACDAPLVPGRSVCAKCRMPVAKMADFLKAKQSALLKGLEETKITRENARGELLRAWLRPGIKVALLLALLIGGYVTYHHFFGNRVPAWQSYPTDTQALLTQFFTLIDADDSKSHDQAYGLMSLDMHHPDDSNEHGEYMQLFHEVHKYLTGEFGDTWTSDMKIEPENPKDAGGAGGYLVKVGAETLHVDVAPQLPKDGPAPVPPHYGVISIREFPIDEAANAQKMAGISAVLGAEGGPAATNNLNTVLGVGHYGRESTMQLKRRQLPLIRDPRVLPAVLLQIWPARKDPVVRARLTSIVADARYAPDVQKYAQQILDGTVDENYLIALGIDTNN